MYLLKNRNVLIMVIFLIGILVLLVILSLNSKKTVPNQAPSEIIKQSEYLEATPQVFNSTSSQTGSLIITSNPTNARVMIDPPEEEVSDKPELPINLTPFKVSRIPIGAHNLTVFKEGFGMSSQDFMIEADKTTTLNVILQSIEGNLGDKLWTTKLPMESKNFYVEYNSSINTIIATLKSNRDNEVDLIKDEILNKLSIRGVDVKKEKIKWIVK